MKEKIARFLVRRRRILLAGFCLLAAVCLILSGFVRKNGDLKRYLPASSPTRIGYERMRAAFPEDSEKSTLRIMTAALPEEEAEELRAALGAIEGVSSSVHGTGEDYNKDGRALFVLTVSAPKDSETATGVYRAAQNLLEGREADFAGDIYYQNIPILPSWVMLLAIAIVSAVLLVSCESWLAPPLFIASILVAIALNAGSNLIFGEISSITGAIAAILQLALSMDYSIMLMERYRRERTSADKCAAMEKALAASFSAIAGSSLTTVAGLLTLVFMSFTIGRDLGLVLAKGVLCSLLCVFCVLPALILAADPLLQKTKKKVPRLPTDRLAAFLLRARVPLTAGFAAIFIAACFLQGGQRITYTGAELDRVADVFGSDNEMALIYEPQAAEALQPIVEEIERDEGVRVILSRENTLDRPLAAEEVIPRCAAAGFSLPVGEDLVRLVYYRAAHPTEEHLLGAREALLFLLDELAPDPAFSSFLDEETRASLALLAACTAPGTIDRQMTPAETAALLGEREQTVSLVYTAAGRETLSPPEFTATILGERGRLIRLFLTEERLGEIGVLDRVMASVGAGEKLSPAGMAALLGTERLSAERAEAIFALFASRREPVTNKLSLRGLIGYLTDGFAADAAFAPFLGEEKIALLARGAEKLDEAEAMLCKEEVCRAVIRTTYPTEGEETYAFVARVNDLLAPLAGRVYFAGDSCYAYEMNAGFNREFSLITLLTMAAIVLIVFLTFRSAVIPPILVAVIQCAVFATMAIMRLSGMTVFFLAILVLQSILMGATIDYAILFTSHYREFRRENDRAAALKLAYRASVGTVLTSATILTAGTLLVGRFAIEIVSKICLAIGYGTVCATLLILIFTPAMIAALDRFVVPKNKNEKEKKA